MGGDTENQPGADVEREIREGRKFSPEEALARMAGPGAMKGASPVSPVQQAETEIGNWLKRNVQDSMGVLALVVQRQIEGSRLLLDHLERPLVALGKHLDLVLGSNELLKDLVREADVEWGRRMDERPHFDRDGVANPADPYTVASVREALTVAAGRLT